MGIESHCHRFSSRHIHSIICSHLPDMSQIYQTLPKPNSVSDALFPRIFNTSSRERLSNSVCICEILDSLGSGIRGGWDLKSHSSSASIRLTQGILYDCICMGSFLRSVLLGHSCSRLWSCTVGQSPLGCMFLKLTLLWVGMEGP